MVPPSKKRCHYAAFYGFYNYYQLYGMRILWTNEPKFGKTVESSLQEVFWSITHIEQACGLAGCLAVFIIATCLPWNTSQFFETLTLNGTEDDIWGRNLKMMKIERQWSVIIKFKSFFRYMAFFFVNVGWSACSFKLIVSSFITAMYSDRNTEC